MSEITDDVYAHLQTKLDLTALVGTRVYPMHLPEKATLPAIVYHEISNVSAEHLTGISGVAWTRLQLDCHALTSIGAALVREEVRLALQAYRGTAGNGRILASSNQGKRSTYHPPADGTDQGRYVRSIDFLICHTEPTS